MSKYKILPYSFQQAKKLNVIIKPSDNKKKKIDVFKNGVKIASIGAFGYNDFPTYIQKLGLKEAQKKRKNYLARHAHEPKIRFYKGSYVNTPSFYADNILW